MGNAVVGKDSKLVDIIELTVAVSVEACPQVCNENLGSLQDTNGLFVLEADFVTKAVEVFGQQVYESCGGPVGFGDAVYEAASVFLHMALVMLSLLDRGVI